MQLKDTPFVDLMQKRVCNVLLIANPYDAFMLEDDGRIDEKIFSEYAKLGLRFPPRFIQVSTEEQVNRHMSSGYIDLAPAIANWRMRMPIWMRNIMPIILKHTVPF